MSKNSKNKGSLTVIGSGIKFAAHLSLESKAYLEQADLVLMLVSEPHLEEWISNLNKHTINLAKKFYHGKQQRKVIYNQIVDFTVEQVQQNQQVCLVTYGHPGVFAYAPHEAIRQTKALGYSAIMTPGISAEDCLLADLGVDPGEYGCQQYEVSQFLIKQPKFDHRTDLILWQIGSLGNTKVTDSEQTQLSNKKLTVLQAYLLQYYPTKHKVIMYIAAMFPGESPVIVTLTLDNLVNYKIKGLETLFIPHYGHRTINNTMLKQLGLTREDLNQDH